MNGTVLAHTDGNVPNLMVNIPRQDESLLGELFISSLLCEPKRDIFWVQIHFNQPGVESYKKTCLRFLESRAMKKKEKNC